MTQNSAYKTIIASASLGAAGLFCLQKAKQMMIENYLMKQHIHQHQEAEQQIKEQLAGQLMGQLPEQDATFGFARALGEER